MFFGRAHSTFSAAMTSCMQRNIDTVRATIWEDKHISLQRLEKHYHILKDRLKMQQVSSTLISQFLTMEQMNHRVAGCIELTKFEHSKDLHTGGQITGDK